MHTPNPEYIMEETFVDYVWIDFPKRTLSIQDNEGRFEKVKFDWTEEGAEGFTEFVEVLHQHTTPEMRHYQL